MPKGNMAILSDLEECAINRDLTMFVHVIKNFEEFILFGLPIEPHPEPYEVVYEGLSHPRKKPYVGVHEKVMGKFPTSINWHRVL
jgi:hypothetical protein